MKSFYLLFLLLLLSTSTYAQSQDDRLKQIEVELKAAIDKQDYDAAAKLKKEKDIRLEIKEAVANGDYEKASKLKKKAIALKNGELDPKPKPKPEPEPEPEPTPEPDSDTEPEPVDNYDDEEYILKNGFFIDGLLHGGSYNTSSYYTNYNGLPYYSYSSNSLFSLGMRMGSKWYFGRMKVYRPGIQATWLRFEIAAILSPNSTAPAGVLINIAPLGIGFTNCFSFGGKVGLEVNVNAAFSLSLDPVNGASYAGYIINPEIKFRFKQFAVGVDFAYQWGTSVDLNPLSSNSTLGEMNAIKIGLTLGRKF